MKVLFVCTGNTCRSPMAAALMRKAAREAGLELAVDSAGTSAADGLPATDHAVTVLQEYGEDLSGHKAKSITREMPGAYDLVLTMTRRHASFLKELTPGAADKIFTLGEYVGRENAEISDPFFGPLQEYRATAATLDELVRAVVAKLKAQTGGDAK